MKKINSKEWREIYSETGTEHLFARMSYASSQNCKQAICGFHAIREPAPPVAGKVCGFCIAEAELPPHRRMIKDKA